MSQPGAKYVFSTEELSVYERIDPDQFDNYDEVDSTTIAETGWEIPRDLGRNDGH